jgi:hypothetical protein
VQVQVRLQVMNLSMSYGSAIKVPAVLIQSARRRAEPRREEQRPGLVV